MVGNKGHRRFLAAPEEDGFAIDPAKVEADAQFDGVSVFRTGLSMSALAVVLRYRNLLSAAQSFLAAKTYLESLQPGFFQMRIVIQGSIPTCAAVATRRHAAPPPGRRG